MISILSSKNISAISLLSKQFFSMSALSKALRQTTPTAEVYLTQRVSYRAGGIKNQQKLLKVYQKIKEKEPSQRFEPSQPSPVPELPESEQLLPQHTTPISPSPSPSSLVSPSHSPTPSSIKCEGCNVRLQSTDKFKYGYINEKILKEALQENTSQVKNKYGQKVKDRDAKILDLMHEVEKESGIQIFDPSSATLKNMDNVEVLLRLEEKIDKYEEEEQLLVRSKTSRKQLICFRCFSLKHHNRLPQEYDHNLDFTSSATDFILNKMLNRHKAQNSSTQYLFMVDALDCLGTFQQWLFKRMLSENLYVSIVVNKVDILHKQYINEIALKQSIKKRLKTYVTNLYGKTPEAEKKLQQIKIFYISCNSRDGIKKLTDHIESTSNSIQLVGYPNTGKTTLLNILGRIRKSTSKVPGTTVKISEHQYRNSKRKVYDMPGLYSQNLLYNLITKPSIKSMLTWHKRMAPGLLTSTAFIYGGKIEIADTRLIIFGLGGACQSTNRWFIDNRREFWIGLPDPHHLNIVKHEVDLEFVDGKAKDLEIAGYGFVGFRLCIPGVRRTMRKLRLYLPEKVEYAFRDTVLSVNDSIFHNKSAISKRFMLERLTLKKIKVSKQVNAQIEKELKDVKDVKDERKEEASLEKQDQAGGETNEEQKQDIK